MKVLILNPNTSEEFTRKIHQIAIKYASSDTKIVTKNPPRGPRSIESVYDELLSSAPTLKTAISNLDDFDGFVIACYSDHPVIYALREITSKPVLGIAEASMYQACMLGYQFSVVTTNEAWEPLLWDAVKHYGLAERCASVRSTGMAVLELEQADEGTTRQKIRQTAMEAILHDKAEVICLGCAGMAGLDKELEKEVGVPVIDGVVSAVSMIEGMAGYGVSTSKKRTYLRPHYKELIDMDPIFETAYQEKNDQSSK